MSCPGPGTQTQVSYDEWTDDDGTVHQMEIKRTLRCPVCQKHH